MIHMETMSGQIAGRTRSTSPNQDTQTDRTDAPDFTFEDEKRNAHAAQAERTAERKTERAASDGDQSGIEVDADNIDEMTIGTEKSNFSAEPDLQFAGFEKQTEPDGEEISENAGIPKQALILEPAINTPERSHLDNTEPARPIAANGLDEQAEMAINAASFEKRDDLARSGIDAEQETGLARSAGLAPTKTLPNRFHPMLHSATENNADQTLPAKADIIKADIAAADETKLRVEIDRSSDNNTASNIPHALQERISSSLLAGTHNAALEKLARLLDERKGGDQNSLFNTGQTNPANMEQTERSASRFALQSAYGDMVMTEMPQGDNQNTQNVDGPGKPVMAALPGLADMKTGKIDDIVNSIMPSAPGAPAVNGNTQEAANSRTIPLSRLSDALLDELQIASNRAEPASERPQSLKIRLLPRTLGDIQLDIQRIGNKIVMEINAVGIAAFKMLEEGRNDILSAFNRSGFNSGDVVLQIGLHRDGALTDLSHDHPEQNSPYWGQAANDDAERSQNGNAGSGQAEDERGEAGNNRLKPADANKTQNRAPALPHSFARSFYF